MAALMNERSRGRFAPTEKAAAVVHAVRIPAVASRPQCQRGSTTSKSRGQGTYFLRDHSDITRPGAQGINSILHSPHANGPLA